MADPTVGTRLAQIKQLPDRFVLSRGEQVELAEEWLNFFLDNLKRGQSSGISGKYGLLPGQRLENLQFRGHENGKSVITINTERDEHNIGAGFEPDNYLFPTDLVSIAGGIAEILREREKFSLSSLAGFYIDPEDQRNRWLTTWATKDGKISETELLRNAHKIIEFLEDLIAALIEYKTKGARPPEGYDRIFDTKRKILEAIVPEIISQSGRFLESGTTQLSPEQRVQIERMLTQTLLEQNNAAEELFEYFFSENDVRKLLTSIHTQNRTVAFKYPDEDEVFFVDDFIETDWYQKQKVLAVNWFLKTYERRLKEILENPEDFEEEIVLEKEEEVGETEETGGQEGEESVEDAIERPKQAVVPELSDEIISRFQRPATSRQIGDGFRSRIQYESAWISNRALYELFATNGIDLSTVDPTILRLIQSETIQMLAGYSDAELARLFASPSERQRAVFNLFGRINSDSNLVNAVNSIYLANNLNALTQLQFNSQRSVKDVLVEQLKKLSQRVGQEDQINDAVITNVVNRLDSIILSYGLSELLPVDQQSGHKDAVWFIQNLDSKKLAIIFFPQLDASIAAQVVEQYEQQLKALLINYVRIRTYQFVLQTNNTNTGKGLLDGVSNDDVQAMLGKNQDFIRHFSPNTHPIGDVQEFSKEKGSDLAATAFVYNPGGSKAQEKIEQIYQTFIPAWNTLDLETQRRIYLTFGLNPGERYIDPEKKLPFLFEFVFLTKNQIEALANPPEIEGKEGYVITFEETRVFEIREVQRVLIIQREAEEYGRMLQAYYLSEMDAEAREQAIIDAGVSNPSFQDLFQADAASPAGRRSLIDRLPFSDRIKNAFKKSAKQKLKEALGKKALESTATKWNPWLSLLSMMRTEEGRKRLGILGGALALAIARALYNMLHSVGGFVGGLAGIGAGIAIGTAIGGPIGAFVGLVSGVGLALLGSEVGSQLLPSSLGFGGSQTSFATGATTTTYTSSVSGTGVQARPISATGSSAAGSQPPPGSESVVARAGSVITNLPIAILAPSLMILITIISTLTVLNVIRNAFLVSAPLGGALSEAAAAQFFACQNSSIPKPTTANRIQSGNYTFPLDAGFAPENGGGGLSCTHWDHDLVTDIFSGAATTEPQKNLPVLAYTSGTIYMVVTDDSLGGLYLILKGDDNRWYYYAHNCAIYVQPGQTVSNGEIIAVTNQTGLNAAVTPEHLHFGIQDGGSEPNFFNGGNVCPTEDFAEKFPGTPADRCSAAEQCTPG